MRLFKYLHEQLKYNKIYIYTHLVVVPLYYVCLLQSLKNPVYMYYTQNLFTFLRLS